MSPGWLLDAGTIFFYNKINIREFGLERKRMIKLYDKVLIKKKNKHGNVIEIDDGNGTKPPIYLIEIVDSEKGINDKEEDFIFWCDGDELQPV